MDEDEKEKHFREILENMRRRMEKDAQSGNPVRRKTYGHSPNVDSHSTSYEKAYYILEHY